MIIYTCEGRRRMEEARERGRGIERVMMGGRGRERGGRREMRMMMRNNGKEKKKMRERKDKLH